MSSRVLVIIGILWLALAGALLVYQFLWPPRVEITWETATEQQTAGFNIYRGQELDGEYVLVNEERLIASQGDPVSGAGYTFIDDAVLRGATYYYVLEEVEFDGTTNRYENDIFRYTVPDVNWWLVALTAASVGIGLALLCSGLRENRRL